MMPAHLLACPDCGFKVKGWDLVWPCKCGGNLTAEEGARINVDSERKVD